MRAAYANWAANWRDDGPTRAFAARDPETGALVGGCELRISPDGTGEVSYWTHAGQRGRGHAGNALTLLVGYAGAGQRCTGVAPVLRCEFLDGGRVREPGRNPRPATVTGRPATALRPPSHRGAARHGVIPFRVQLVWSEGRNR